MSSGTISPVYLHPGRQAEALGAMLASYGFTTEVLKAQAHHEHPCVVVSGSLVRHMTQPEYIYAAPDPQDGTWWFWRPDADDELVMTKVSPIGDVSATADLFARTIRLVVLADAAGVRPEGLVRVVA
jgi:hypothetical protein